MLRGEEGKQHDLASVLRYIFIGNCAVLVGRQKAIELSLLHRFSDLLVVAGEIGCLLHFGVGPMIEVPADSQRAVHRYQKTKLQRDGTLIHPVWTVRDPGHHYVWSICVSETVLDREAIQCVGVV